MSFRRQRGDSECVEGEGEGSDFIFIFRARTKVGGGSVQTAEAGSSNIGCLDRKQGFQLTGSDIAMSHCARYLFKDQKRHADGRDDLESVGRNAAVEANKTLAGKVRSTSQKYIPSVDRIFTNPSTMPV